MKTIYNIFPKRTTQTKRAEKKIQRLNEKIIVDYREKNSFVASELVKLGFEVEFKELKVADYIVKGVAIERKTVSDFISSMINRRLLRQVEELQQYPNKLLIIEGIDEQEIYNDDEKGVNGDALRGFLLSIVLKHKIPIIFTKNSEDTARFISVIAKKQQKETPLNITKKTLNSKEQKQYILEAFPGIGPKTAKKLLKKFKTIKNIINAPIEELKKDIGKKSEIFRLLKERY